MDQNPEFAEYLRALLEEGGTGNRLLVSGKTGWAVFSGKKGERYVTGEVATNAHLSDEHKLDDAQIKTLRAAGFIPVSKHTRRLRQVFDLSEANKEAAVADQMSGLMERVYALKTENIRFQLHLGDGEDVDNPRLRKSMRKVSRVRSHAARMELYQEMINATFLLVVENPGSLKPRGVDKLGPWDVFAVFTDEDSMRSFDPRGVPVRRLYGHELFPLLMGTELGSLRINPDGDIGGELYRNEVETIANAVRRFYQPRST